MSHLDQAPRPASPVDAPSGLTRRSVVRTGAHLAWAVPAVSLVTAAPALAVSQGPEPEPELKITSFSATGEEKKTTIAMGPVKNTGTDDAGQLTAVVILPKGLQKVAIVGAKDPQGWKVSGDRTGKTLTFVSIATELSPDQESKGLTFTVSHRRVKRVKGTASVTVTGNGASDTTYDGL